MNTPMRSDDSLAIGALAERSGLAPSALRYYEAEGLIAALRNDGGHRRYARGTLRRVAFIGMAQAVGLDLKQIRAALATLPDARTPTAADWQLLARSWQPLIDARIEALMQLRDQLTACIGCGCLSLKRCGLYNPQDSAATRGAGPRYLMGDTSMVAQQAASPPASRPRSRRA